MLAGGAKMARIESVEGTLYRVAGDSSRPIGAGETIDEGEEVRTAKGSTALVRMADGSLIEMSERAGFSLDASRKGNTIQLERGRIIVQAAKQRDRHLYVATRDALVSVVGTIFSVNSGTKGSRVSVVEGEVHVQQGEKDSVLHPGNQVTTHASVERVPVKNEVAWSRNAKEYDAAPRRADRPGQGHRRPRGASRPALLDPAARPRPGGDDGLDRAAEPVEEPERRRSRSSTRRSARARRSPSGGREMLRSTGNEQKFHDMIEKLGALGPNLGDEVAVAMNAGGDDGENHAPVLLAQVTNEAVVPRHGGAGDRRAQRTARQSIRIVDDPADRSRGGGDAALDPRRPAGGLAERRRAAQGGALTAGGTNPFTASRFYGRIAQDYQDGAGWLFAADLHTLVRQGQVGQVPGVAADGRAAGHPRPRPLHHRPPGDRRPGRDPRRPHLRPDAAREWPPGWPRRRRWGA